MRAAVISDTDGSSEYQTVRLSPQNWYLRLFYLLVRALNKNTLQGVVSKEESRLWTCGRNC